MPIAEETLAGFVGAILVAIAAIDIASRRVPNWIVLPSTAIVIAAQIAFARGHAVECAVASLLAGLALLLPNLIRSSWIGMGDVKLAMLLGATLGWGVAGALELAFISVLPVALLVRARGRSDGRPATLPFAPFMAFGGLFVMFAPQLLGG
jgi:leader peptidase (prepilin peptidase) / N-methyltransferase